MIVGIVVNKDWVCGNHVEYTRGSPESGMYYLDGGTKDKAAGSLGVGGSLKEAEAINRGMYIGQ